MTGLSAVGRADAVVRVLDERGELTVPELAEAVGTPQSSVYRFVNQLASVGWIESGSVRGTYRLGSYFLKIGAAVEARLDVREVAREHMRLLAEAAGSATTLMIHRLGRAVCVERSMSASAAVLSLQVGDSVPLPEDAGGLVLLAFLPSREKMTVLESHGMTGSGLRQRADLVARLEGIRVDGVAFVSDDRVGTASYAVPVFNHRREVVASLVMAGVSERIVGNASALATLQKAAADISRGIGFEGTPDV